METKNRYKIKILESLIPEQAETGDLCYFEDLDAHIQEIIIDLFASIIENKQNQQQEE
ncbi:MAG: hypothetical protein U9N47_06385 [Thermodesulfobacteriota bacterium]|nr:hypothetical protein [Thermodesulfobacteriota bacterium]